MKTKTSRRKVLLRRILVLPVLAILIYGFSTTKEVQKPIRESGTTTSNFQETATEKMNTSEILSKEQRQKSAERTSGFIPPTPKTSEQEFQEVATPEMVAEYNALAKELKAKNGDKALTKTKLDRMKYIYSLMTAEQKSNSEAFPDIDQENTVVVRQDRQEERVNLMRQRQEERTAVRRERQIIREERKAERREREMERLERLEEEVGRRTMRGEGPPAPPENDARIPLPPPPPPPPAPEDFDLPVPPPPPSPVEAVKEWMQEGAQFFYNGKAVSGDEALKAVQTNDGKNLNIHVVEDNSSKTVRISDN